MVLPFVLRGVPASSSNPPSTTHRHLPLVALTRKALRRLEEIEELRRQARERKADRARRRDVFIKLVESSAIVLQRAERGRRCREIARRRAMAAFHLGRWARAITQRAALMKATRDRAMLKIRVDVSSAKCWFPYDRE